MRHDCHETNLKIYIEITRYLLKKENINLLVWTSVCFLLPLEYVHSFGRINISMFDSDRSMIRRTVLIIIIYI